MKKILFISSELDSGGVSKSFISLLNTIDKINFDIYVLLASDKGIFTGMLPSNIHLIIDPTTKIGLTNSVKGIIKFVQIGCYYKALLKFIQALVSQFSLTNGEILRAKFYPKINIDFDLAIDYGGQLQLYYMVKYVKAKTKISFFHNDYKKWPNYYKSDKFFYGKIDYIYSISDICVNSLKEVFPEYAYKCRKMENISSIQLILKLSEEPIIENLSKDKISILTIGHICERKGTGLALKAAYILKDKGIDFNWIFIGATTELNKYHTQIQDLQLENNLLFLGIKSNPYSYIKAATIYVQPSMFEGKSIALDEAKIMCKPIVVTNFSTVTDQFTDRVNASVSEMTPNALSDSIIELIQNQTLRDSYISNLDENLYDNSIEIQKLYDLI